MIGQFFAQAPRWTLLLLMLSSGACSFHPFGSKSSARNPDPGDGHASDRTSLTGWTVSGTTDRPVTATLGNLSDSDADPASFAFTIALGTDGLPEDDGESGVGVFWSSVLVLDGDETFQEVLEVALDP